MNLYVLVEGSSVEPKVYPHWIKEVNPKLTQVFQLADLRNNNFYIFSGGGYPNYLDRIKDAVADLNSLDNIDRLVISVDAEEMTVADKFNEVDSVVQGCASAKQVKIVIQNCCFESWCLGNRKNFTRTPQSPKLRDYIEFYDVYEHDPEALPSIDPDELTRAQFAAKYLSECCKEKGRFYNKSNPSYVANGRFFYHVRNRQETTGHISTVQGFLSAFV